MKLMGSVDQVDFRGVSGWIAAEGQNESRYVRIVVDGVEFGTTLARLYRQDLKDKGISNGYSGYRFQFPEALSVYRDHEIVLTDRDTGNAFGPHRVKLESLMTKALAGEHPWFAFELPYVTSNICNRGKSPGGIANRDGLRGL